MKKRLSKIIRTTIACVSLITFPATWGPWSMSLVAQSNQNTITAAQDFMNKTSALLEIIPTEIFEPKALAETLENNPSKVLEWVINNIGYVAYNGILKGPKGTLMARQGNSLDRAILLQSLMESKGVQTRFVRSRLTPQHRKLLLEVRTNKPADRKAAPLWMHSVSQPGLAKKLGIEESELRASIQQVETTASKVTTELQSQSLTLAQRLIKELSLSTPKNSPTVTEKEHTWLQFKTDQGKWKDACCDFGETLPSLFTENAKLTYYDNIHKFPSKLFHTLTIRILVTRMQNEKSKTQTALEETFRTARYGHQQISWGFKGIHSIDNTLLDESHLQDLEGTAIGIRESILNENEWTPYINVQNENESRTHQKFDDRGNLTKAGTTAEDAVQESISQTTHKAANVFDVGSKPTKTKRKDTILSGVTVEYVFKQPGSRTIRELRPVFQLTKDEILNTQSWEASRSKRALALTHCADLYLQSGILPEVFVDWNLLKITQANSLAIKYIQRISQKGGDLAKIIKAASKTIDKMQSINVGLIQLASNRLLQDQYLPTLNLIASTNRIASVPHSQHSGRAVTAIDIVRNQTTAMPFSEGDPFTRTLHSGIADTLLEAMILRKSKSGPLAFGAARSFQPSAQKWTQLQRPKGPQNDLPFSAVSSDFKNGYLVYADDANNPKNWWRINPKTGEVLGMCISEAGIGGQAMSEDISMKQIISISITVVTGCYSVLACLANSPKENPNIACVVCALLVMSANVISGIGSSISEQAGGFGNLFDKICNVAYPTNSSTDPEDDPYSYDNVFYNPTGDDPYNM